MSFGLHAIRVVSVLELALLLVQLILIVAAMVTTEWFAGDAIHGMSCQCLFVACNQFHSLRSHHIFFYFRSVRFYSDHIHFILNQVPSIYTLF